MKLNIGKGEIVETDNYPAHELIALRNQLQLELHEIRNKLAVRLAADEYTRLYAVKKKIGQNIDQLNRVISLRTRAEKADFYNRVHQAFIDICKERMPPELFTQILAEAYKRCDQPEPES